MSGYIVPSEYNVNASVRFDNGSLVGLALILISGIVLWRVK